MIRRFNGVAASKGDDRVVVNGRALSPQIVFMRKFWADALSEATGRDYDWRSYADRGIDLQPVKALSRGQIEADRRNGGALMAERARFVATRNAGFVRRIRNCADRRIAPRSVATLAEKAVSLDARVAALNAFSPMAVMAAMAILGRNHAQAARTVHVDGDRAAAHFERLRDSSAPGSDTRVPKSPPNPGAIAPREPVRQATTAHSRVIVASGQSALPSGARDPKSQVASLVERQWAAQYEKEHKATMQRVLAESEARAAAPKRQVAKFVLNIVDEGGISTGNRHRNDPEAGRRTAADILSAIAFGGAMIASGWRTSEGEEALATTIGMERAAFASATRKKADEILEQGHSPARVRDEAYANASERLRPLFERLEGERRAAKRARKAKEASEAVGGTESAAAASDSKPNNPPEAVSPESPATTSKSIGRKPQLKLSEAAQKHGSEDAEMSQENSGISTEPDEAGSSQRDRMPVQDGDGGQSTSSIEPAAAKKREKPRATQKEIVTLALNLGALLSMRGLLHAHVETICDICCLPPERVRAETNQHLLAMAGPKGFTDKTQEQILIKAKIIGDARMDKMVAAITSSLLGKGSRKHRGQIILQKEELRGIKK